MTAERGRKRERERGRDREREREREREGKRRSHKGTWHSRTESDAVQILTIGGSSFDAKRRIFALFCITRNLCYVRSEFCRFPCRRSCLQGRAEQYITFFPYAVYLFNCAFFGSIPGQINCSKCLKSAEYERKKFFDLYVMPSMKCQGRT
jgi:hypothetical protein